VNLDEAVRDAVGKTRRPGLLVVGAADTTEVAVASSGPIPRPDCPADRVLFEIGSITKVFTALLLAVAVQRREVGFEDPLQDHVPAGVTVPSRGEATITLVHLATHTSGLPRLPPRFLWEALRRRDDPYARLTADRVLASLAAVRLRRPPGERFRYSNFGAGLLGLALVHAAGKDLESLVRERITGPLGMSDTVITMDEDQRSRLAPGTTARGRQASPWTIVGLAGAGALRSTVGDLLTFVRAQMGASPPGTPPELTAAIRETHVERSRGGRFAPALRMGLGWMLLPIGRGKLDVVWHNGGTGGYRSYLGCAPTIRMGAVALSSNVRSVDRHGTRVLLDLASSPSRRPP
jgi:CubicO group peptidase (beta-lactamase class C family)